mmetsp:Transcript_7221/g.8715  ORF Transcript_7221/g.8715 Transcript_7221/m.8715 type:complete len:450 (+) Transcript_7221:3-1352(+)
MPDNRNFIKNIEFCDPALKFVGRRTFYMSHCFFYLASMAIVIASIVLVSEALDIMLSKIFGRTFALSLNGGATTINFEVWSVNNCEQSKMCKPFVTGRQTRGNAFISLGYLLCFLTIFPISTTHLSQGLSLQYISLGVTLFTIPTMIIKSAYRAATNTSHLSFVVVGPDALSASGIVLFNLMYGIFVCTWLSEKRPDVSVKGVVYSSSFTACALMIGYGCAIAAASADIANDGLLENTEQGEPWPFLVCALSFGFFVIASGIPVACTMARRNLQHSAIRIVDDFTANAICVYFPWSIAWIFYTSPPYRALVNFSGLFIVSWLALWLPFFVLLHALHPKDDNVSYLSWYLNHLTACDHHLINDHVLQQQVDDGDNQPASFEQATDRRVQEGHTSDDDSMPQTVLSPLPTLWLQRRARPVYAILLFLTTLWIFGSVVSYSLSLIWLVTKLL